MTTTIQVRETTKQILDSLKSKEKKGSYDEVIVHLLKVKIELNDMFGYSRKNQLKFKKEDEMVFDEI